MLEVEELVAAIQKESAQVCAVEAAKLAFLPVVAETLQTFLARVDPNSADIGVGGWWNGEDSPPRLYGMVRLYFRDRASMQESAAVFEALSDVLPVENWTSHDDAASLTRSFTQNLGGTNEDIDVYVYWSVADSPDSGCFQWLVRVERKVVESENSVYEIVCKEAA